MCVCVMMRMFTLIDMVMFVLMLVAVVLLMSHGVDVGVCMCCGC